MPVFPGAHLATSIPAVSKTVGPDGYRSTTQKAPLGSKIWDENGNEYTYIKAGAAIAQNDAVKMNGSALGYDDVRSTAAAGTVVFGVATYAFNNAEYGFVCTRGVVTCKVVVATAAGSPLVTNGTSGTLALADATAITYRPIVALVTGVAAGSAVHLG